MTDFLNKRYFSIIFLTAALVLPFIQASPAPAQDTTPYWPTDGWQTSTPEQQGMDSQRLADMLVSIQDQNANIHSVLVVRNGTVVAEAYRYTYDQSSLNHLYSCTKSVISALVGIAIEQGYLQGVDQRMVDFFPDRTIANLDDQKQAITLEDMLTMTAGLDWPGGILEPELDELWSSTDWVQFMLDRSMANEPGTLFVYNSGVSNLLAVIISQSTSMSAEEFARQNLFEPLGISTIRWQTDPDGNYLGGWGLWMTTRDMAKFGYLYLNGGLWDGQQVVPAEWVETSTTKHVSAQPLSDGYGYQWWVDDQGYYMALGYGGQYIIVDSDLNLVVVFTSSLATTRFSFPETLLTSFIIPAVQSQRALPDNPDGTAALEAATEAFAQP